MRVQQVLLASCLATLGLNGATHRLVDYPNPAIKIVAITGRPEGGLWLAAEDGLYLFTGRYIKMEQYPLASPHFLGVDRSGTLWIGDRQGLVRYRDTFQIVNRKAVDGLAMSAGRVFVLQDHQLLYQQGDILDQTSLQYARPELLAAPDGRIWFPCHAELQACWFDSAAPERRGSIETQNGFHQAVSDARGQLWLASDTAAWPLGREGETPFRRESLQGARAGPLVVGPKGRIWFIGKEVVDLSGSARFSDRRQNDVFPPTAGYEDPQGRLWVAYRGRGLVQWVPDQSWERWFREDLNGTAAAQVAQVGEDVIAATHGGLLRLHSEKRSWASTGPQLSYDSIAVLTNGELLAASRERGLVRLAGSGRLLEQVPNVVSNGIKDYRALVQDSRGVLWAGNRRALVRLTGFPGPLRAFVEPLPGAGRVANVSSLERDSKGSLWVGYGGGLARLDEQGQWRPAIVEPLVPDVRSFALGADIWVALRHSGPFFRLTPNGDRWTSQSFGADQGYGPPDTHFLRRDSRGWIWRGSTDGVHVSDGVHVAPEDWLHLHAGNGLAGNATDIFGFFEDQNHGVWLCGEEGITHLTPDASWFSNPAEKPTIAGVWVDGQSVPLTRFREGLAGVRNITVAIDTTSLPPWHDGLVRYRLAGNRDWKQAQDGVVEFRDMPGGDYQLEVVYSAAGSATLSVPIRIGAGGGNLRWLLLAPIAGMPLLFRFVSRSEWYVRLRYQFRKNRFMKRRERILQEPSVAGGTDSSENLEGQLLLERFVVQRRAFQGGFSVVYEGLDKLTGQRVAIKRLNGAPAEDATQRYRFVKEVAALRSVHHPGIVPIIESWLGPNGEACLAMPYLDGPTLRHALKHGITPRRAARIIRTLGSALVEIHRRGIIHRDLKPENVILTNAGMDNETPVLIDFGNAGLHQPPSALGMTETLAGSLRYMAPEGLTGHYSAATDVYSLGVMILELASGKTLSDLGAAHSDAAFLHELQVALGTVASGPAGGELAELLADCYCPIPDRRPPPGELAERAATIFSPGSTDNSSANHSRPKS